MSRKSLLNSLLLAVCLVLGLSLFAPEALANAVLDGIANSYKDATGGWSSQLNGIAKGLFIKLAGIEVAWAAIWWLWEKDDPTAVMVSLLRVLMGLMFFWAILLNFDTWIPAIIDGFSQAGQQAGGLGALTPSTVMDRGLEIATSLMGATKDMSVWDGEGGTMIVCAICALMITLAFAVIAGQMLVTLVESYFCISAGVLFLGFAGSRWTTTFAEKYISYAVSVGVKLFVTYLVIAAGQNVTATWASMMKPTMEIADALIVLCGAGIFMFLGWQIPAMASSMLTGSVSMTLGSAMATGATMAGGMAGALAATTAVGGKLAQEGLGALRAASAAASAGSAAGGGVMSALSAAGGAIGSAAGGAVSQGIQGLGKNTVGGRLADRMSAQTAGLAEAAAAGTPSGAAPAQPPAPSAPPAQAPTAGAASAPANGSAAGNGAAPSGTPGAGSAPASTIDTTSSIAQALAERDGGGQPPSSSFAADSGAAAPAGASEATGGTANGASSATQPPAPTAPSAPASAGGQDKQPQAPGKSTREKVADGLAALGNQPNDSAAGAGVQINMKLHD